MLRLVIQNGAIVALAVLVGCTAPPPQEHGPLPSLRDQNAPMASQVDVSAEDMAGDWHIRQRMPGRFPFSGDKVHLTAQADGGLEYRMEFSPCSLASQACAPSIVTFNLKASGPGRWLPQRGPMAGALTPDSEFWVLWMDADRRTVAVGTPSGEFGFILDRAPMGGGDRITAAREIMEWFGYQISELVVNQ